MAPATWQWSKCQKLDKFVTDKMIELGACYALCPLHRELYYWKEGDAFCISLDYLRNPEDIILFDRQEYIGQKANFLKAHGKQVNASTDDGAMSQRDRSVLDMLTKLDETEKKINELKNRISSFLDWRHKSLLLMAERFGIEYNLFNIPELKIADAQKREILHGNKVSIASNASFFDVLRAYRDYRGMSEVDLYKKAGISKQAFSKIRSGKVRPKRETVITFAVVLDLSAQDTDILLSSAGYSLRMEDAVFVMEKATEFLK